MSDQTDRAGADRSPLAVLKGFVRQRAPLERCELCGTGLAPEHPHVLHIKNRQLVCACDPCALLFVDASAAIYKRVPHRITELHDFALTDEQWEALSIPIDLAFFLHSTPAGQMIAVYPSPAGPTESLLQLEAWDDIVGEHPRLRALEPDVEALLVNRVRRRPKSATDKYFVVPIDECYRLVGLMRKSWRGLSGGTVVWNEIAEFFAGLEARADARTESARA